MLTELPSKPSARLSCRDRRKLDGYYLLSDALEIPDLRQRAFHYLGNLLKRCFGLSAQQERDTPLWLRRVFAGYGVLAVIYSASLLLFVAYKVGGFLMYRYQILGQSSCMSNRSCWRKRFEYQCYLSLGVA